MIRGRVTRTWHVPFRVHLLLLVAGTLTPLLVLSGLLVRRLVDDNRATTERRLIAVAQSQAAAIDGELTATIRTLQALAESSSLDAGDLKGFHAQAVRVAATQPSWFAIVLSQPDGRQVLNTSQPWGAPTLPSAAVEPISHDQTVVTRAPVVGSLRRGPLVRRLAVPVRVPVIRGGRVDYVLSALVTAGQLSTFLSRGLSEMQGWTFGLIDAEGTIVARTRHADRLVGDHVSAPDFLRMRVRKGIVTDMSADGEEVYASFSRVPVAAWTVSVTVPRGVLDSPIRDSMLALGGLGFGLMALGGLAAFILSRRVSRDLAAASEAADALAQGTPPVLRQSVVTEVRGLGRALARSARLIEAHERARDEQFAQVEAARAHAESADRAKDDFLAMLGHELRNPLAPVLTALRLMQARGEGAVLREREVIERQVQHLSHLVDDLLDVSRLRRGKITLRHERFELAAAVQRAVEIAEPLMAERRHLFQIDVPGQGLLIDGDEMRVAQVLANLLTNAAKYTEPGGQIRLTACAEAGQAVITCEDNGAGIPVDLLPRMFDLFQQGERSLDRGVGGLGLGLALARSLTELHGGSIHASSAGAGQGSCFVVRLPLAAGTIEEVRREDPLIAGGSEPTVSVLVVDDNRDALEMLVMTLECAGFAVRGALSGEDALNVARDFQPDVAVLDIGLPGMDGYELARRLRATEALASIQLVALTGYGQEGDVTAARDAGFHLHMVKPGDLDALIAFIHAARRSVPQES